MDLVAAPPVVDTPVGTTIDPEVVDGGVSDSDDGEEEDGTKPTWFLEHKMKVLVTGATGFLGKNLVPVLSENHEVIGVGSQFWDLRDQDTCSRLLDQMQPEVIVHAAGSVGGI